MSAPSITCMSVEEVTKLLDVYDELSAVPSVLDARLIAVDTKKKSYTVESRWSQRDVHQKKSIGRQQIDLLAVDGDALQNTPMGFAAPSTTLESRTIVYSPKDDVYAVLTSEGEGDKKKHWLRVFDRLDGTKTTTINLTSCDKHGAVLTADEMGAPQFSHGNGFLLYIADALHKPKTYFEEDLSTMEGEKATEALSKLGSSFTLRQSWGEQMVDCVKPSLALCDINAGTVTMLTNIPDEIEPVQPRWLPDDSAIIFIGMLAKPYKLGMRFCFNRPSAIYRYDVASGVCTALTDLAANVSHCWPRVSPDGTKCIYFERRALWTHDGSAKLMCIDLCTKVVRVIVDHVVTPVVSTVLGRRDAFPGLYVRGCPAMERCWMADGVRVVITSQTRSSMEIYMIDTSSSSIVRLTNSSPRPLGNWATMDMNDDVLVAVCSAPNRLPRLVAAHIRGAMKPEDVVWTKMGRDTPQSSVETTVASLKWKVIALKRTTEGIPLLEGNAIFEAILVTPADDALRTPLGLVAIPHGGPHSASTVGYTKVAALFAHTGLATLFINYRGSTGYGDGPLDALPGRCGDLDVKDCAFAVTSVLDAIPSFDRSRVFVFGGSHGGFLAAHLVGQHPDMFAGAVMLNPVLDLNAMLHLTDIRDWVCVEGVGVPFVFGWTPDAAQRNAMADASPSRYVKQVKCPVHMMIGEKDKRVNPHYRAYCEQLTANGVHVTTSSYPDSNHGLGTDVGVETDMLLNAVAMFMRTPAK